MATLTESRDDAQTDDHPDWLEPAGRAGLVAKAVIYALLAVLVWQLPGGSSTEASHQGAMERLAAQPFGEALLLALGVGLIAYASWQLTELLLDGDGPEDLTEKGSHLATALVYAGIGAVCFWQLSSAGSSSSNDQAKQATSTVFDLPAGRWLVIGAGIAFASVGVFKAYQGVTQQFIDNVDDDRASSTAKSWVRALGTVGFTARGVVLALVGGFLLRAGVSHEPQQAKGLDASLKALADSTVGPPILYAVAAGLTSYALFCLTEARYREIPQ